MKKLSYEEPEVEFVQMDINDVIVASPGEEGGGTGW